MTRPYAYAKTDANHKIVSDFILYACGGGERTTPGAYHGMYHGYRVAAYDVSKLGGEMSDWIVTVGYAAAFVEVKQPGKRNDLTDGERALIANATAPVFVVETSEQVQAVIETLMMLPVEMAREWERQ